MTNEEAIKELNELSKIENAPLVSEATKMGAKALQKQVPMKPKVSRGKFTRWYNCSACKGWLKGNEKFCNCGQRLDWSEANGN